MYSNSNNYNSNSNSNSNQDYLEKMKSLYNDFMTNKHVRYVICPFDDSSEECQTCYKFCTGCTCMIFLLVLYLIFSFK